MIRATLLALMCLTWPGDSPAQAQQEPRSVAMTDWQYQAGVELPADRGSKYVDFVLTVDVFDGAREDLADLRLYDAQGREVPYSLRVRHDVSSEKQVVAETFNRNEGPEQSSELSLDLGGSFPHNKVDVKLAGDDFRRRAVLEGCDDRESWQKITEKPLLRFSSLANEDTSLTYPISRYRYLRLRVYQDPQVDDAPPAVTSASVQRQITVPGESITRTASLGPREPVRIDSEAGSAWFADLGGKHVPVTNIHVQIAEREFARTYQLAAASSADRNPEFFHVASGQWQRLAGETRDLQAKLGRDQRAARLKLMIEDYANPPLTVTKLTYTAAVRQVVIESADWTSPLTLFFGNPQATAPNYDFGRNLPPRLETAPVRVELAARVANPSYLPPPLPFTERWPGVIYVVLAAVSAVLALVIYRVGKTSIEQYDQAQAAVE